MFNILIAGGNGMKYFILKVPTFLWLLTLTILSNFFLYSLFLIRLCPIFSLS